MEEKKYNKVKNTDKDIAVLKKINTIKISGVLLILCGICALVIFLLNALEIVNMFEIGDAESSSLQEFSLIGTCVMGIMTGVLCLIKINSPDWYGILYILSFCTIVINLFIVLSYGGNYSNYIPVIIIIIESIFAFICVLMFRKIKSCGDSEID